MCIYYDDKENLTYTSQEHIFPAGLGGIEMLPSGYVSDKANNYFSKMETVMMNESLAAIARMFHGPGSRGKNKIGDPMISVMSDDNGVHSLGYIFLGKPYTIPHILIKKNSLRLVTSPDLEVESASKFIEIIKKFNDKYCLILDAKMPKDNLLIGYNKKKFFIGTSEEKITLNGIKGAIEFFINNYELKTLQEKMDFKTNSKQVNVNIKLKENNLSAKVFAKIGLNVIAKFKDDKYLQNNNFSKIKKWIIGENSQEFDCMPEQLELLPKIKIPDNCHYCLVMNIGSKLFVFVYLYSFCCRTFQICNSFDTFFDLPKMFFCDFQNKEEYTLEEGLVKNRIELR